MFGCTKRQDITLNVSSSYLFHIEYWYRRHFIIVEASVLKWITVISNTSDLVVCKLLGYTKDAQLSCLARCLFLL
jgi:hypothetical protein